MWPEPHLLRMDGDAAWVIKLAHATASTAKGEGEGCVCDAAGSIRARVLECHCMAVEASDAIVARVGDIHPPTRCDCHSRGAEQSATRRRIRDVCRRAFLRCSRRYWRPWAFAAVRQPRLRLARMRRCAHGTPRRRPDCAESMAFAIEYLHTVGVVGNVQQTARADSHASRPCELAQATTTTSELDAGGAVSGEQTKSVPAKVGHARSSIWEWDREEWRCERQRRCPRRPTQRAH